MSSCFSSLQLPLALINVPKNTNTAGRQRDGLRGYMRSHLILAFPTLLLFLLYLVLLPSSSCVSAIHFDILTFFHIPSVLLPLLSFHPPFLSLFCPFYPLLLSLVHPFIPSSIPPSIPLSISPPSLSLFPPSILPLSLIIYLSSIASMPLSLPPCYPSTCSPISPASFPLSLLPPSAPPP